MLRRMRRRGLVERYGFGGVVLFWGGLEVWSGGGSGEWKGGQRESPLVRSSGVAMLWKNGFLIGNGEKRILGIYDLIPMAVMLELEELNDEVTVTIARVFDFPCFALQRRGLEALRPIRTSVPYR